VDFPLNVEPCAQSWARKRLHAIRVCGAGLRTLAIGIRASTAMLALGASRGIGVRYQALPVTLVPSR
jgi:hypothetical protein